MTHDELLAALDRGPTTDDYASAQVTFAAAARIRALVAERDEWKRKADDDTVLNSYADENQRLFDRAEKAEAEVERLRGLLREFVYEATHLSPMRDDGSHDCRISARLLNAARAALAQEAPDGP